MLDARIDAFADRLQPSYEEEVASKFEELGNEAERIFREMMKGQSWVYRSDISRPRNITANGVLYKSLDQKCVQWPETRDTSYDFLPFINEAIKNLPSLIFALLASVEDKSEFYVLECPMGVVDSRLAGPLRLVTAYDINFDTYMMRIDILGRRSMPDERETTILANSQ